MSCPGAVCTGLRSQDLVFLRPVGGHRLCEGDWRDFSSPGLPGGLSLLSPTLSGRTWCSPLSPLQGGGAWGGGLAQSTLASCVLVALVLGFTPGT